MDVSQENPPAALSDFRLLFVFSAGASVFHCVSLAVKHLFPSAFSCVNFLLFGIILFWILGATMEWTTPQHEEIDLNCEVSSYANAEL